MQPTPLTKEEIAKSLKDIPSWRIKDNALFWSHTFDNFKEAVAFVDRVAALADNEEHHPDIAISYTKVELTLSTHSVGGLSARDFNLARKIEALPALSV